MTASVRNITQARWFPDAVALVTLVVLVAGVTIAWTHPMVNSFTVQTHGDQAWVQASAQVGMQTGPFATNLHTGWFSGFDPWAYPTGGAIGFYSAAWLLGLITASSSNVLLGIMTGTAVLVALASYAALRLAAPGRVSPVVAWWGAFALGISPYVLSKMGHYNVAAFYLLPVILAAIGLLTRVAGLRALGVLAIVAVVTLLSPLWWTFVAAYFLVVSLLVAAILRRRSWFLRVGSVLLALLVGGALPIVLSLTRHVGDGTWNRQPWDSTIYSGSLTDFLLGSPFVTSVFPQLEDLLPATSRELSTVGLVPAAGAIFAIVLAVTAFLGYSDDRRRSAGWLLVLLQITLLTFVTLGLGTTQEALLRLVGIDSPLRGWSRLTILVALIGLMLAAPWVTAQVARLTGIGRLVVIAVASLAVIVVGVGDLRTTDMGEPRNVPTLEELAAIEFLDAEVGDCPVAQLPVGTFPDFPMADGTEIALSNYYRGFVPYILRPDRTWSFGASLGTPSDTLMRSLPATITAAELVVLRDAGYCAVLYDHDYAAWLQARGLDWPGQETRGLAPNWSGLRFDVYRTS